MDTLMKGMLYFLDSDLNFCLSMCIGTLMSGRKLKKRKLFYIKGILYLFMFLIWSLIFYLNGEQSNPNRLVIGIIRYSFIFCVTIIWCFWLYKCRFITALHCVTVAYCLEHIAQRGSSLLSWLLGVKSPITCKVLLCGMIFGIFGIAYKFLLKDSSYSEENEDIQDKMMIVLAFFVVVADIVLSLTMGEVYLEVQSKSFRIAETLSTIIISILALIVGVSRIRESKAINEKNMLKQVLDLEQEKYQREKAVAEIINIKCHDLKHRISNLESRIDSEELQEINRVVDEYEGNLHTGNATLDVVLRNKNLLCQQNDINFTCIANGKLLSFMKDSDIYALFGNLMDNGIEAAQRLENKEMRVISLTVTEKFSMIFIHMENYFQGEIIFEGRYPRTQKKDKMYHGYGTHSIRYLAEKYDGDVQMNGENGIFMVDIMIPKK